jgi:hypothetical protein
VNEGRKIIFSKMIIPPNKCPAGHKQDEDGRCPCCNNDAY